MEFFVWLIRIDSIAELRIEGSGGKHSFLCTQFCSADLENSVRPSGFWGGKGGCMLGVAIAIMH